MVIGRTTSAGMIPVILGDDELIPRNLNERKVVIFRQGNSTGRQLLVIKPLGDILPEESDLLRPVPKPSCNYTLDPDGPIGPVHQHEDGTWWFYEATWNLEQGPFPFYEDCLAVLTQYCIDYQKSLTSAEKSDIVGIDEKPTTNTD
jgi:hypothetical protein